MDWDNVPTEALLWASDEKRRQRDTWLSWARDAARQARAIDQVIDARNAKTRNEDDLRKQMQRIRGSYDSNALAEE